MHLSYSLCMLEAHYCSTQQIIVWVLLRSGLSIPLEISLAYRDLMPEGTYFGWAWDKPANILCVYFIFFTLRDYVNYFFFSFCLHWVSNFLILMICWLWMFLIVARLPCPASYQKYLSFLVLYYYLVYHLQLEATYERSRKNLCG